MDNEESLFGSGILDSAASIFGAYTNAEAVKAQAKATAQQAAAQNATTSTTRLLIGVAVVAVVLGIVLRGK